MCSSDLKTNSNAKLITQVININDIEHLQEGSVSNLGTGGIKSKIEAARICQSNGVEMWIVNGSKDDFAVNALKGLVEYTRFK